MPLYGQEFLGAAKYAKFAIENLPAGRCGKTFAKEFGNSMPILRNWAGKKKHPIVATHGLWRGGAHDYSGASTLTEGLKELEKFTNIALDFPEQKFQFSIFCEHKLKTPELKKVFTAQWNMIKAVPNIILVNAPMSGGDLLRPGAFDINPSRLLNEFHGNWNPRTAGFAPYMWACDGMPAQDCDIQYFKDLHQKALVLWLWMQQYNCKKKVDESTPIAERTVVPVKKQVISLEALIPNKASVKFEKNSTYKSHADQHGNTPKGREQKPVIITPTEAERLDFIGANKKVIITAPRQGNFLDGRPMYRASEWGYEIENKAMKVSNSKVVEVVAVKGRKKTSLGTISPAFRQNAFRHKAGKKLKKLKANLIINKSEELTIHEDYTINKDWV